MSANMGFVGRQILEFDYGNHWIMIIVLESRGKIVGVEVKSSSVVGRDDAKGLMWLRERLGDAFVAGVVLSSGRLPVQLDDRVWALPLSALWSPPKSL